MTLKMESGLGETLTLNHRDGTIYCFNTMKPWYVYIIRCNDMSLYTGVTTDVARRFEEHKGGRKGSKYVKARIPLKVVHVETYDSRSEAQQREYVLKRLTKTEKETLIKGKK